MLVGIYSNQNEITVESFKYVGTHFRGLWEVFFAYLSNFVDGKTQRFSER